jgi:hypothetical protein
LRLLADDRPVRDRYADLVAHCPTATVYQTVEWLEVWKHLGAEVAFVEIDRETLMPFVLKGQGALKRAYSLPFDTYGGPVTPHPNGPVWFETAIEPLGRSSARVVDFSARMTSGNGAARRVSSHIVDLSSGYDAARARYTDANLRLLRQGVERGAVIEETASAADISAIHRLHLGTVARHGARALPRAFFDAVLASLVSAGLATFTVARHEGSVIAANLVLRYHGRACDWMWVYDDRFLHLRATNALIDRAIRDEAARGARELNLGASPNDRLGSVRFKQSFGAVPFDYQVYAHTGPWVATARRVRERVSRLGVGVRLLAGR